MIACTICSRASAPIPRAAMPARSRASIARIRATERLCPIARRSSSASPPVNPAATIAIRRSCSWKSGTPSVRSRIGASEGWGYSTGARPRRRSKNGCTMPPTIGPGRMIATCTTRS